MKVAFPIPKNASGDEFNNAKALLTHFSQEPNGRFIIGKNWQWHGGVHVTEKNTSHCITHQPVRAIADGKIVAYRMNEALLESELPTMIPDKKLVYSTNFCLIEHNYEGKNPDTEATNVLKFYSLYMHLAPPVFMDCYKISEDKSRYARTGFNEEDGVKKYDPNNHYAELTEGCIVKKLDESVASTFTGVKSKDNDSISHTFVPVEVISGGLSSNGVDATDGKIVWMVWDDSALEAAPMAENLPWLSEASEDVTVLEGDAQITVNAGDGIGFLGDYEYPIKKATGEYDSAIIKQVHLEVFSDDDANLEDFLNNKAGLTGSTFLYTVAQGLSTFSLLNKTVAKVKGDSLRGRNDPDSQGKAGGYAGFTLGGNDIFEYYPDDSENYKALDFGEELGTLQAAKGKVLSGTHKGKEAWFCVEARYTTTLDNPPNPPVFPTFLENGEDESFKTEEKEVECQVKDLLKDENGKEWLKYDATKWIVKEEANVIQNHDFIKQGYQHLDILEPNYDLEEISALHENIFSVIDADNNGSLSNDEIKASYKKPEMHAKLHKLVVKTLSEWYQPDDTTSSAAQYFKAFLETTSFAKAQELCEHELERLLALEWMNEAIGKGLAVSERVWHMSPLLPMELSPDQFEYTEEFKVMVSTIYGEAANSSSIAWRAIAFVIMNRVGVREWKKHKDVLSIIKYTGFDAYTHKTSLYKNAINYLNGKKSNANEKIVDKIIEEIYSIYTGKDKDFTDNSVIYYSPNAQKALHNKNSKMYTEKPKWNFTALKETNINGLDENDDFKFYKYK